MALVARRTYFQLHLVRNPQNLLDRDNLAMVLHALGTSTLDCCNVFCVGLPFKMVWMLQMVQNVTARMGFRMPLGTLVIPVLKHLLYPFPSPIHAVFINV